MPLSSVIADPVNDGVLPRTLNLVNKELAGAFVAPNIVPFAVKLSAT